MISEEFIIFSFADKSEKTKSLDFPSLPAYDFVIRRISLKVNVRGNKSYAVNETELGC
jgi:hypothetical protein